MKNTARSFVFFFAIVLQAGSSAALPTYLAGLGTSDNTINLVSGPSSAPVSVSATTLIPTNMIGEAAAGPQGLTVLVGAASEAPPFDGGPTGAIRGGAFLTLNDIIIAPLGFDSTGTVTASLNLHLSGFFFPMFDGTNGGATIASSVSVEGGFTSSLGQSFFLNNTVEQCIHFNGSVALCDRGGTTKSGILSSFDGDDIITTPLFQLPIGQPIFLVLGLSASAGAATDSRFHLRKLLLLERATFLIL